MIDLYKTFWYDVTNNMRLWAKIVIGVPVLITAIIVAPIIFCAGAFVALISLSYRRLKKIIHFAMYRDI